MKIHFKLLAITVRKYVDMDIIYVCPDTISGNRTYIRILRDVIRERRNWWGVGKGASITAVD
jgi:hypothetical protein